VSAALWPADYQTGVCGALTAIASSSTDQNALTRAGAALDFKTVATEAAALADIDKTAQDDMVNVPTWAPGAELVRELTAALANMRKAENEYELGVPTLNASLIKDASTLIGRASGQINAATSAFSQLRDAYGFSCP
jgi:hypothetical protein